MQTSRSSALVWMWLGASLLVAAVVAPAAFAVLPSRALAGAVVGRVLPVIFWAGIVIGAWMLWEGRGWRRVAATFVVLACAVAQLAVAPRIAQSRRALGPDMERVAPDDPRRVAFGRLHALSVGLLGIGMAAAGAIALGSLGLSFGRVRRHSSLDPALRSARPEGI